MLKVAILGANGFVGSRAVEMLHLGQLATVRPIVRTFAGLARCARFQLDSKVADATDEAALRSVLEGCDVVIHSVVGNPRTIIQSAIATYLAASKPGVRRLV